MVLQGKRNLTEGALDLTEKLIDFEVEVYLQRHRGSGMEKDNLVRDVQEIMDSIFKPEVGVTVELDKLSGSCIIVYSHELGFEEVIKYIGKQINKK
jgi:hypothetical protein